MFNAVILLSFGRDTSRSRWQNRFLIQLRQSIILLFAAALADVLRRINPVTRFQVTAPIFEAKTGEIIGARAQPPVPV
jgi:hypothetical protein